MMMMMMMNQIGISPRYSAQKKNYSLWYIAWIVNVILHLTDSVQHRLSCDGQTDVHMTTAYTALAEGHAVKTKTFQS